MPISFPSGLPMVVHLTLTHPPTLSPTRHVLSFTRDVVVEAVEASSLI